ncbi:MAG TPA: YggS family pyridoxal phosphate-dependent enzyme [Marinilabiliales bacterium]|nr:MAG: YggS family pyridoxal phosphate enzyme [Bacteroidetes bacterium GWC2_40_13]OFX75233.1 MAG: YggS family pyridoxal phosphate enzyme [Bacteroidetes bacterium GWD2_40_43]OFX89830.1 MAG: YggS family pyridoxal phosphate enzyme [Bacteroidetes bacterium GWE2_40_63]OFY21977.1 MAG: YggS family pyridoxal phosphate enzyme [Bacteroidetes bacterium GWF2_40_13]OFZ30324.1 MAG: YggS family pyridoxal phosphate enzyme [Bacteroidetes bacterium RIFOXYC2_FULL_40_12]HAM97027.1 YggS family pyridoxal phosphate
MSIATNLLAIQATIPKGVRLVAVSKTKPNEAIMEAYQVGQRVFGENRPQELRDKQADLPKDIEWHFIGHLQTNKVKYIAPFVSLIHGVESLKLLQEIDKEARKSQRVIPCLLEFHIAEEETKYGLNLQEAREILTGDGFQKLEHISICGVMGMATYTQDEAQIRKEFKNLKLIFETLKKEFFNEAPAFCELSMGMSGDYLIAIQEGSTLVRIGSSIFGSR